jgi:hypothetical protein
MSVLPNTESRFLGRFRALLRRLGAAGALLGIVACGGSPVSPTQLQAADTDAGVDPGAPPSPDLSPSIDPSVTMDLSTLTQTDAVATGDGAACVLHRSFQPGACDACVQASCCVEVNACADVPACVALMQCHLKCLLAAPSCSTMCDAMYPAQVQTLNTALGCPRVPCQAACAS